MVSSSSPWKIEAGPGGAAGTAFGRVAGFANIFNSFVRTSVRIYSWCSLSLRRADKAVLAPVVSDLFAADELIKIKCRRDPTEGKAVRFGNGEYVISSDHRAGCRHILITNFGLPVICWAMSRGHRS